MTRSILLAAAAASLLVLPVAAWSQDRPAASAPASAPVAAATSDAWTVDAREDWLVGRLHRAQDEHDIDDAEAQRIYKEVGGMRDLAKRISTRHGGFLTANETAAQKTRLDTLVSQIHWLREGAFQRPW